MYFLISGTGGCQLDVKYYSEKEQNKRPILVWRDQLTDVSSKKNVWVSTYFRSYGRPRHTNYLSCCRYYEGRLSPGCQMMTKTRLKIKLCLNARSDCDIWDICHQYPSLRQRETGGWSSASEGWVRTKAGWPAQLSSAQRTTHHTPHHTTAGRAADPPSVRVSVCHLAQSSRTGGRVGTGSLLGWEDEERWEEFTGLASIWRHPPPPPPPHPPCPCLALPELPRPACSSYILLKADYLIWRSAPITFNLHLDYFKRHFLHLSPVLFKDFYLFYLCIFRVLN